MEYNTSEENRFKSINDFKWCIDDGGEVEFVWCNQNYSITHPDGKISICKCDHYNDVVDVNTSDELLNYMLGNYKLRDVITKVEVLCRTTFLQKIYFLKHHCLEQWCFSLFLFNVQDNVFPLQTNGITIILVLFMNYTFVYLAFILFYQLMA